MSFIPNGYNLYDMAGNVWELCQGWDVDVDEDGPFKVACECKQCKQINRQEAWEYEHGIYTREDLR